MRYKTRKRLAILILVVGVPLYLIVATWLVAQFERPHPLVEVVVYAGLGLAWALPLRKVFLGIGKPDPDDPQQ